MEGQWNLLEIFLAWVALLVVVGAWIYFMRKGGSMGPAGYSKYLEQHMAEIRRHNERLEALLERMDARLTRLEDADVKGTSDRL